MPVVVKARISQGNDGTYSHRGEWSRYAWDFDVPPGSRVVAARAGVVIYARGESAIGGDDRERYNRESNTVVIDHLDGTHAVYLHLQKRGNRVRVGEYVQQGEWIARSGDTGWAGGPHLHYTVRDARTHKSIASRFTGVRTNHGVPVREDVIEPAPPPAIPQKVIDRVKAAWRTSREAERLDMIGLAWNLAGVSVESKHATYFYVRVLALWRETLHLRTKETMVQLSRAARPTAADMLAARRLLVTIPRGTKAFKAERRALVDAMRAWPPEARLWAAEIRALKAWVRGLEQECAGDRVAAFRQYGQAVKKAGRRFRPVAAEAVRRVVAHHLRAAERNFNRLEFEAGRVRAEHVERLRVDARNTFATSKSLIAAWREVFRRDKREIEKVRAALEDARRRRDRILKQLDG